MPRTRRPKRASKPTGSRPSGSRPSGSHPSPSAAADNDNDNDGPIFFWKPHESPHGIFSQWYTVPFTAPSPDGNGTTTYSCAEQFMMHRKAHLFGDAAIAAEVLETEDPRLQRALGRAVRGFDEDVWVSRRSGIVEEGSYWRFRAQPAPLLATRERELVEASPRDRKSVV